MSELDNNVYCAGCNYPESRHGPNPLVRESVDRIKHHLDRFLEDEEYKRMMNRIWEKRKQNDIS